jgi:hypothetical protein
MDQLVVQVRKAIPVVLDHRAPQVKLAMMEQLEQPEQQAHKALLAQRVILVLLAKLVMMEQLVAQVLLVMMEPLVVQVLQVMMEPLAQLVLLALMPIKH